MASGMASRGVRNPMKMSDISFLKTEPSQPQNSKAENSGGLGTVFHIVSFTIHLAE